MIVLSVGQFVIWSSFHLRKVLQSMAPCRQSGWLCSGARWECGLERWGLGSTIPTEGAGPGWGQSALCHSEKNLVGVETSDTAAGRRERGAMQVYVLPQAPKPSEGKDYAQTKEDS